MSNRRKLRGPLFEAFADWRTRLILRSTRYSGQKAIAMGEGVL